MKENIIVYKKNTLQHGADGIFVLFLKAQTIVVLCVFLRVLWLFDDFFKFYLRTFLGVIRDRDTRLV